MRTFRLMVVGLGAVTLLAIAGCSRVADDWKAAQAADTNESYQQFLKAHADSEYATQAQERLKQLAEDHDWQQAAGLDTRDAYEQFVAQHADGTKAQEARVRIENFKLAAGDSVDAATGAVPAAAATAAAVDATSAAPAVPKVVTANKVAPKLASTTKPASADSRTAKAGSTVYVQLGSFSSNANAQAEWSRLRAKSPKLLAPLKPHYATARVGGKTVYRLQVGQRSRDSASSLCGSLKKQSISCVVASG